MGAVPQTAVVTGAAGAIGREVVRVLLDDGWHVVGVDVSPGSDRDVQWVGVDVRDAAALAETADALGPLGLLVDAHAVWPAGIPTIAVKDDQWGGSRRCQPEGTLPLLSGFLSKPPASNRNRGQSGVDNGASTIS